MDALPVRRPVYSSTAPGVVSEGVSASGAARDRMFLSWVQSAMCDLLALEALGPESQARYNAAHKANAPWPMEFSIERLTLSKKSFRNSRICARCADAQGTSWRWSYKAGVRHVRRCLDPPFLRGSIRPAAEGWSQGTGWATAIDTQAQGTPQSSRPKAGSFCSGLYRAAEEGVCPRVGGPRPRINGLSEDRKNNPPIRVSGKVSRWVRGVRIRTWSYARQLRR